MPRRSAMLLASLLAVIALSASAAEPNYAVVARVPLDAATRWDYAAFETRSGRVFATLGDHVAVFDPATRQVVGRIPGVARAHGVVFAPERHQGYISSGEGNSILTFDLEQLGKAPTRTTPAGGENPDALLYLSETGRLYSFNGKSHDISVIDPDDGRVTATIALTGKPEFAAADADRLYLNLEDIHQLAVIDLHRNAVLRTIDLLDCEDPTGLDYDRAGRRIFSVCANGHLVVTDAVDGHRVADVAIGLGADAAVYDPVRHVVISSNGKDGTLSIVRQRDADHYELQQTVPTADKARTMAYDPGSGTVYLPVPAAEGRFDLIMVAPGS